MLYDAAADTLALPVRAYVSRDATLAEVGDVVAAATGVPRARQRLIEVTSYGTSVSAAEFLTHAVLGLPPLSAADADAFRDAAYIAAAVPPRSLPPASPSRRRVGVLRPHAERRAEGAVVVADNRVAPTTESLLSRAGIDWTPVDTRPRVLHDADDMYGAAWSDAVREYAALDVLVVAPGAARVVPRGAVLGPPGVVYLRAGSAVVEVVPRGGAPRLQRLAELVGVRYIAADAGELPANVSREGAPWLDYAAAPLISATTDPRAAAAACGVLYERSVTPDALPPTGVGTSALSQALARHHKVHTLTLAGDARRLALSLACALSDGVDARAGGRPLGRAESLVASSR